MAKVFDCHLEASEFELQSCYCVRFRSNPREKKYETSYPHKYGLNSITVVFLQGWLGIKQPTKVDMLLNENSTKHK